MQLVSDQIKGYLENSSWIRRMFETGIEMKKQFGNNNVFDFSLGNPDLPPPVEVKKALEDIAADISKPFALGYMPNAGYPEARAVVAADLEEEQQVKIPASNVIVTCGAAGAINAFFRAILEPGDEVICPAPYFVEYGFYAGNFGGKLCPVKSKPLTFELDLEAIDQAFTSRTRAVIINSPNNPTGQIYSHHELEQLAAILEKHSAKTGRPIYLISDEPYRFLTYDKVNIQSVFSVYKYSVVVGSYSKSLSLAGGRIGYFVANPAIENSSELLNAVIMTNRILGFVNAPALAQKVLIACIKSKVDINIYRERRDEMAKVLDYAGIEYSMPRGAFYFFPKSPVEDESIFIKALMDEHILAVPGRGFGYPGYFRLTFCVGLDVIRGSKEGFKRAVEKIKA
ncbi:MAG: pyridoxal phosphate-dependent aminotransferase [Victivallaceae bacterium]